MPDVAPLIAGYLKEGEPTPPLARRRWRMKSDFVNPGALSAHRQGKVSKIEEQSVKVFVSDEWTLEYDLALGPKDSDGNHACLLAKDVFIAAHLAEADDRICSGTTTVGAEEQTADAEFGLLSGSIPTGTDRAETLAARVYAKLAAGPSKPIAAQYLAERLLKQHRAGTLTAEQLRTALPKYLVEAINHATRQQSASAVF